MKILALDLGTRTGWATWSDGMPYASGTWVLATAKELKAQKAAGLDRCCDLRAARLQERITAEQPFSHIYFEDVQFASTSMQAHLWGGFRGIVTLFYPESKITAVPVGTLKKFATGNGAAKKEQMRDALPKYFLDQNAGRNFDDNEIDAFHLLRFALVEQNRQSPS